MNDIFEELYDIKNHFIAITIILIGIFLYNNDTIIKIFEYGFIFIFVFLILFSIYFALISLISMIRKWIKDNKRLK